MIVRGLDKAEAVNERSSHQTSPSRTADSV